VTKSIFHRGRTKSEQLSHRKQEMHGNRTCKSMYPTRAEQPEVAQLIKKSRGDVTRRSPNRGNHV
jgi:hypothetical protein